MGDPPPMPARRLTAKGRATRARIVEAAAALMSEHGVAGTSIDDVRRAAGVSGSQMQHYFNNKRSLVRAVIAWQAAQVLEDPAARSSTLSGLREWVGALLARQQGTEGRASAGLGLLVAEVAEFDSDTRAELALGFERWEQTLRTTLEKMRDRHELRAEADPDRLALALLCALQGGMLLARTKRSSGPMDAALGVVLNYIETLAVHDSDDDGEGPVLTEA
jgi:AcrR family transcriptional regulator